MRNTAGRVVTGQLLQGADGYWREPKAPATAKALADQAPDLQAWLAARYAGLMGRERTFKLADGLGNLTAALEAAIEQGVLPRQEVTKHLHILAHNLLRKAGFEAGASTAGRQRGYGHGHDIPEPKYF